MVTDRLRAAASHQDVAFPTLSARDIDALRTRGTERAMVLDEVLFAEGDRDFCFFVVLDGAVEIRESSRGTPHTITVHRAGEFTGDIDTLTGRAAMVTGVVIESGHVLQLSTNELRRAVDELPELGDTILTAFLMRRTLLLDDGFKGVKIIGSRFSPDAHRLRDFATRNGIPYTWVDLETDRQADALVQQFGVDASATPIVIGPDGKSFSNPSVTEFARYMGIAVSAEPDQLYDLVVVGAGPAGLAASVYAASEGLHVLTVDAVAAGGQAGTSTRIENYLGFPAGISGAELTRNALLQALKFGARVSVPARVVALHLSGGERVVTLDDGTSVRTRCILVASGVAYRKLDVPRFDEFDEAGIYYAATDMEARLCRDEEVVVVGAGNSAGQAIVYLARYAKHIHMVVRGTSLETSMSRYLIDRVTKFDNVSISYGTNVTGLDGNGRLSAVHARGKDGVERTISATALFLFIGTDPKTEWIRGCIELDAKGYVLTGNGLSPSVTESETWRGTGRQPYLLETSLPGIFAAGDVRSGSIKRVASAVGEGSMSVSFVHSYIARPV